MVKEKDEDTIILELPEKFVMIFDDGGTPKFSTLGYTDKEIVTNMLDALHIYAEKMHEPKKDKDCMFG